LNSYGVRKFQPRVGACDNPGTPENENFNAESVRHNRAFANAFSVGIVLFFFTQGWNNPGLEFANAFSVGHGAFFFHPGLEQPWAGFCERFQRWHGAFLLHPGLEQP
jgi:hypothetical protein